MQCTEVHSYKLHEHHELPSMRSSVRTLKSVTAADVGSVTGPNLRNLSVETRLDPSFKKRNFLYSCVKDITIMIEFLRINHYM